MSVPVSAPAATAAPSVNTTVPTGGTPPSTGSEQGSQVSAADDFHEITIDGKAERLSMAELKRLASLSKGADKRFEESAKQRRQAEALMSRMRTPEDLFELIDDPALGYDQDRLIKAMEDHYYRKVIQPSEMTPEQRELAEAKERIRKYEEGENKTKEMQQKEREAQEDAAEAQKLQREIIDLINESGLPKSKFTSSRIAYWMRINESKGLRAPKELIVQQVRKETRDIMNSMVQSADGDVLVNLLGDETAKKLRKLDIDRIRARRQEKLGLPSTPPRQLQADNAPKEKIDMREVKRRYREFR